MPTPFVIPTPKPGPYTHGPDSQRHDGVPRGTVTKHEWRSEVFAGTVRDYFVYVPAQYASLRADQAAALMVFQDGGWYADENSDYRVPVVFDNLIHQGKMPVTIGLFINPGQFPATGPDRQPVGNRSFEYDTLSDQYARFLMDEMIPELSKKNRITQDPDQRAICGSSSGGICSWTVAWERPDAFRKVLSHVGSFANIRGGHVCPFLVRKTPRKPIRIYLQAGSNDLERDWGSWPLANLQMASALQFMEYDYHLEFGDGAHDGKHGGAILPESLIWLWR